MFQVQWLVPNDLAQKQMVFNSLISPYLIMITGVGYQNTFIVSLPKCIDIAPLVIMIKWWIIMQLKTICFCAASYHWTWNIHGLLEPRELCHGVQAAYTSAIYVSGSIIDFQWFDAQTNGFK